MRAALLLLPLALCAACLRSTDFNCTLDTQCNPGGKCQTSVGYCSFADSGCSSGQRFGDSAGPYAGQCVGNQSGGDGGMIDARPIDGPAVGCPNDFTELTGGPPGHLYKKIVQNLNWVQQDNLCRTFSQRAYLAVPDDATELTNLHTLVGGTFWIGVNNRAGGPFIKVSTNTAATFLPWQPDPPDTTGGKNCAVANATNFTTDKCEGGGAGTFPAACECEP